jgi:hypothetical protein
MGGREPKKIDMKRRKKETPRAMKREGERKQVLAENRSV